ncbi:MAG: hypothetical protein JWM53_2289, partial [bacterium]|nr:hypothetical protein [bacterium]
VVAPIVSSLCKALAMCKVEYFCKSP